MLNMVHLQVLAAVAQHGSVTEAARVLHYSQPSVSHHLARLEDATGARLGQRIGPALTPRPPAPPPPTPRHSAWIGGCDRCQAELIAVCRREGFTPRIGSLSDDM